MATKASMVTYITAFFDRLLNKFQTTAGLMHEVLFYDNSNGVFSFTHESAIRIAQIATTATELSQAKAAMESNTGAGEILINAFERKIEQYDRATSTWGLAPGEYTATVKQMRAYYSPWSRRVWYSNNYGELKRFMTSGRVFIG